MHMGTKVARAIRIPVATGERLCTKFAFQEILRLDAVDVIRPDLGHAGGLTEVKKIAAMAEAGYVQVASHNASGLVGTAAAVQLDAVIPNFLIQEYFVAQASWIDDVVLGGPRVEHGEIVVSDRPELGVDLSEGAAAAHPFQSTSGKAPLRRGLADRAQNVTESWKPSTTASGVRPVPPGLTMYWTSGSTWSQGVTWMMYPHSRTSS